MSTVSDESTEQRYEPDPWVGRLRSADSTQRDAALVELRELLVRGLSRPMSHRYGGSLQAEDVVQEALLKILESLDQFQGRSRFTTWAMTIATRIAISKSRRKHFQDVSIDSFSGDDAMRIEVAVDSSGSGEQAFDRQALIAKMQEVIDTELTEKQRFAIRALLEGMPVEVIAEKAGSNRNSIYKLIHDARQRLRRGLENAGVAAEDIANTFA